MSDAGRKDFTDKVKENVTPESSKSTTDKVKESVTDAYDSVAKQFSSDEGKSATQEMSDKASRMKDNQ